MAVAAFPLRFHNTLADVNMSRPMHVSCEQYFESLLWYFDGKRYPFMQHPTFKYWALNFTQRRRTWEMAGVFASRQLPEHITTYEIAEQVAQNNDFTLRQIYARAGNIKGSTAYWMQERNNWNCVIMWLMFFFKRSGACTPCVLPSTACVLPSGR